MRRNLLSFRLLGQSWLKKLSVSNIQHRISKTSICHVTHANDMTRSYSESVWPCLLCWCGAACLTWLRHAWSPWLSVLQVVAVCASVLQHLIVVPSVRAFRDSLPDMRDTTHSYTVVCVLFWLRLLLLATNKICRRASSEQHPRTRSCRRRRIAEWMSCSSGSSECELEKCVLFWVYWLLVCVLVCACVCVCACMCVCVCVLQNITGATKMEALVGVGV